MAQPPVVGIDIGSQLMKAVELSISPKEGLAITALAVAPTPPGVLQNGILTDPIAMATAVKQMLKDAGIRAKRTVGCIAGQASVVVRIIEVPRMTPAELTETMKWEVERHVPFAPTEVEMDYQPLPVKDDGSDAENPNMSVLLAVAQREMVGYYTDALLRAGLEPVAIDIEPLAAGRALLDIDANGLPVRRAIQPMALPGGDFASVEDMAASSAPRETVAVVNIGASNTDISIFEDGMLIFPRSLALAGESLTRAISESLGYTIDQAERLKIESGQVLMDRLNDYGNQSYNTEAVEFPYGQPDEDFSNVRPVGLPDSGPLSRSPFDSGPLPVRSPFDSGVLNNPNSSPQGGSPSDRRSSGPLGASPASGALGSGSLGPIDLERTQPIQRRTLDLARRPQVAGTAPLGGGGMGADDDGGFGAVGMGGEHLDVGQPQQPDELTIQVFDAMLPVLSELATELRRSLDYYRSRAAGRNVDRLVICGGTASLPHIDKFLEQEMLVPVQVANPMQGLSVSSKSFDASYLQTIAPLFTIAVGLAERQAVFAANPEPKVRGPRPAVSSSGGAGGGGKFALPKMNFNLPFGKRGGDGTSGAGGNTTLPPVS